MHTYRNFSPIALNGIGLKTGLISWDFSKKTDLIWRYEFGSKQLAGFRKVYICQIFMSGSFDIELEGK